MAHRGSGFSPDEELSEILTKLWDLDSNKCEPGVDYEVNLQGYVTDARAVGRDRARYNLFEWVSESVFERDTYKAFKALLDNYESELGRPEQITDDERQENSDFLDLILATDVMKEAHSYLVDKGRAPADLEEFKEVLDNMWFRLIQRTHNYGDDERYFDSSSFEHVFVGESRGKKVIGLHNWIQFYLQERLGNIDYHGYFRRETLRNDKVPRLMALQFTWKEGEGEPEKEKPITSMFLGSSPEFEIAAFTLCRLLDKTKKHDIQLGEYEAQIVVYKMHNGVIGTAYIGGARV